MPWRLFLGSVFSGSLTGVGVPGGGSFLSVVGATVGVLFLLLVV